MSADVTTPMKPGDKNSPTVSPASPAAVDFRYTQTDVASDAFRSRNESQTEFHSPPSGDRRGSQFPEVRLVRRAMHEARCK